MFQFFNEENLQFPEIVFNSKIKNNTFNYMNLIMAEVYKVIFQDKLPRVLPEMEEVMQFSLDRRVGD